jgi:hypothetical protein
MPNAFRPIALLLAAAVLSTAVLAADANIAVSDATVRAVPPGTANTAAFMTIKNNGATDRKLVKADSSVAKTVELHTHTNDNGVMKMRQVPEILVKAKERTELKPGSFHIMLIDLKQTPKEGETVAVTLTFDDGSSTTINAPVTKPQAMMPMGKDMDHSKMKH